MNRPYICRYKAVAVAEDNYLLKLIRYTHQCHIQEGLVCQPTQYNWLGNLKIDNDSPVSSIFKRLKPRLFTDKNLSKKIKQIRKIIIGQKTI